MITKYASIVLERPVAVPAKEALQRMTGVGVKGLRD